MLGCLDDDILLSMSKTKVATHKHDPGTKATLTVDKPRVQTVKLTDDLHVQLVTFGARNRRTNQDILVAALSEYLERHDHR
jgi:hypothetical protein